MIRVLADENFNGDLLRALCAAEPDLDVVRAQDCGLEGAPDSELLEWAAHEKRVLLTHDRRTIPSYVAQRPDLNLPVFGVIEVKLSASMKVLVEHILMILSIIEEQEWVGQVLYIPIA